VDDTTAKANLKQRWEGFFKLLCALVVATALVDGCTPMGEDRPAGQGPGHRPQSLVLTPDQEIELGRRAYLQVLSEMRERILPADAPQTIQARRVCARLVKAAGIEPLQREINLRIRGYRFDWQVNVVEDRQINAFCLPGGRIVVFTGLMAVTDNDDQLAAVLGHEIAHALAHHANERVARDESGRVSFLRGKAYDRAQESEADHIGLFLMVFAGYRPEETIRFWQRMEQRDASGRIPEFLSDHPSGAHRIRDFQIWIPQALAGKKAFDEGRIATAANR
jgi:predicted Zn-dependent protease